jgi:endonuclease YncB( thermonuclease family)
MNFPLGKLFSRGLSLGISSKGSCMARTYQILLPLLSLFLVRVDLTDLFALQIPIKVLKIYDGDTILAGHGSYQWRVRFSKIDSPELGQPFLSGSGDAGKVASNCLKKLIKEEGSYLLEVEKHDIYGRVLGDIKGLSLKQIQAGCTTLYPYAQFRSRHEKFIFLRALKKAKAQRQGIWKFGGFKNPGLWRRVKKRNEHRRSLQ